MSETEQTVLIDETSGGLGGPESIRPRGSRDTRLIERALAERWPIPIQHRAPLIERQVAIATDPTSSPREATSAFVSIMSASRINLEIEKTITGVDEPAAVTVNVGMQMKVIQHDDWYGSRAAAAASDELAENDAGSSTDDD